MNHKYHSRNREKNTVEKMINMYCNKNHKVRTSLCESCSDLREYAFARLDSCRYADNKPVCKKCPAHCYNSSMREQIRKVMRFSGPRMMIYHPIYTLFYLLRKFRDE